MDEYKRLVTAGKYLGVEAHILSAKETKELYPLLDEKVIVGSIYSPQDGSMDPTMLTAALTKAAKNHGARVKNTFEYWLILARNFKVKFFVHN